MSENLQQELMLRGSVCSQLRSSVHNPSLPCNDTGKNHTVLP